MKEDHLNYAIQNITFDHHERDIYKWLLTFPSFNLQRLSYLASCVSDSVARNGYKPYQAKE